ncbi:MAG: hypothetical protein K8S21_12350 [Gemmatimonadetes bacterium]|nr:hypothetical protein [Gemmatimonadota bacterium]
MTSPLIRLGLLALALTITAPAVSAQQQDSTPQKRASRPRGDRNKLTRVEIDEAGTGIVTARDAVRLLRPQWLRPPMGRVAGSNMGSETGAATQVIVYIDDLRQPDLESSLVTVPAAKIVEIRYLDQNRAMQQRGPGHEAGVIEVITTDKRK